MPKPSIMQQLMATAAPIGLGYYALDKTGGLGYLTNAYNNFMYPTGVYSAEGTLLAPDAASYFAPAATTAPTFETALVDSFQNVPTNTYAGVNYADASGATGAGNVVTDAGGAGSGISELTGASNAGYVNGADLASDVTAGAGAGTTGGISEAAGWDAATAGEYGGPAAADAITLSPAEAEATAEGLGIDWASTAAELGPYAAAAYVADRLTGGAISGAVGDVVSGVGNAVSSAWEDLTGGCFLTTAATEHAGEEDNGPALTAMRELRDDYMRKFPQGRKEIEWYYRKAPKIVAAIDKKKNAHEIYMDMYENYIKPTQKAVKAGNYEDAHQKYNRMIGFAKKASGLSTKELSMNKGNGIPHEIKKNFNTGGLTAFADGGISVGSRPDADFGMSAQTSPDVPFQTTVGNFAAGGISHLGSYSDGGRLLRGPGDGVSDSIPATIGGKQPARLADGEFVVPARIVSELGNGSTGAGARKLYAMVDRVQAARSKTVVKGKVAKNTRADKYLPK
jgi:hypothetical protein